MSFNFLKDFSTFYDFYFLRIFNNYGKIIRLINTSFISLVIKTDTKNIQMDIIEPNNDFDFSQLKLSLTTVIPGGAYFTKYLYKSKPLYIQTYRSTTRQGFVKNGKKYHCDLMFDNSSETFIHWIEKLEEHSQQLIFSNADKWFQNELSLNDIEEAFNTTIKVYKSGTYYLIRVYSKINSVTNQPVVKVYDEYERQVSIKDITNKTNVLSILEFQGIKFTSRSFQIEIEVKQIMIVKEEDAIFESCLIKKSGSNNFSVSEEKNAIVNVETVNPSNPDPYSNPISNNEDNVVELVNVEPEQKPLNDDLLSILKIEDLDLEETKEDLELKDTFQKDDVEITNTILESSEDVVEPSSQENLVSVIDSESIESDKNVDINKDIDSDIDMNVFNLDIEDIEPEKDLEPDIEEIKEIGVSLSNSGDMNSLESITLKNPNQVYFDLYKEAKKKAKDAKKNAILAYLEVKNIKKTYMLNDINDSDSEINSDFSENDL
jgi:hypothetical protein